MSPLQMISPEQLDLPLHCVKETLGGLDSNKDGFIDLREFSGVACKSFYNE